MIGLESQKILKFCMLWIAEKCIFQCELGVLGGATYNNQTFKNTKFFSNEKNLIQTMKIVW